MAKPIYEKLLFYTPLADRLKTHKGAELKKIIFITTSIIEKEVPLGESGYADFILKPYLELIETLDYTESEEGALLLTEDGASIPARGYPIVDWAEAGGEFPHASLTFIILEYADGKRKKACELTMGQIDNATFKMLQGQMVDILLNPAGEF